MSYRKSLLALLCCFAMLSVMAVDYPTKPVEATVQWNAGGGADLVFRIIAEVFPKYADGQTLVIKNVPGAAGVTGCTEFLDAAPDGYKVMHWSNAHVSKSHMSKVPYDVDSYTSVIQVVEIANYLLVQKDAKWESVEDFVADAKANPEEITIGNAGNGGGNHLAALLFEDATSAKFVHVPFNGGSQAVTGLLSGQVDAIMANAPEGLTNVDAGQFRILVTCGSQRFDQYPDVPRAIDAGIDAVIEQWRGIAVPNGTPAPIIARIHDIFKQCIEDPIYVDKVKAMGAVPRYRNTADFDAFVHDEDNRFETLIKSRGFGDRYTK